MDLQAATKGFEQLKQEFPDFSVALLHGRMSQEEKEERMRGFERNDIQILVSTTVIEVGIDVPNATVMLIENAERFGLTQLHQLRGRVGRGKEKSYCILVNRESGKQDSSMAEQRLSVMVETNDGFRIAEEDLKLRGPGDFFGTRQSGFPELKIADFMRDKDLLYLARKGAFELVNEDPNLSDTEHSLLKKHFLQQYREQWELSNIS